MRDALGLSFQKDDIRYINNPGVFHGRAMARVQWLRGHALA
jgi:hypothetical protein